MDSATVLGHHINFEARIRRLEAAALPVLHVAAVLHRASEGVPRQVLAIAANVASIEVPDSEFEPFDAKDLPLDRLDRRHSPMLRR